MSNYIVSMSGQANSLQISVIGNIPAGDFKSYKPVLIKNITDDNIRISIKPVNNTDFIETILYPGWNVEVVSEIKGVTDNTLQYGY